MTQYLLSVYPDPSVYTMSEEELAPMFAATAAFNDELQAAGSFVFGGGLHPAESATVVRADGGGDVTITDGPYAETKEHVGGFWIIEAPDLDTALAWAAKGSAACDGTVEVRPFQDDPA